DTTPEVYPAMSDAQRADLLDRWNGWVDELAGGGCLVDGKPLEPYGRLVSAPAPDRIVDGPFAEAKEAVGGYFLVTADDLDAATRLARDCPLLRHGMTVEVRAVS